MTPGDSAKTLTEADLLRAGEELAYLSVPVEARLTADSYVRFKAWIDMQHDPFTPRPVPTPFDVFAGIRIIVDETIAPDRIEFRDQRGNVTAAFDVPS